MYVRKIYYIKKEHFLAVNSSFLGKFLRKIATYSDQLTRILITAIAFISFPKKKKSRQWNTTTDYFQISPFIAYRFYLSENNEYQTWKLNISVLIFPETRYKIRSSNGNETSQSDDRTVQRQLRNADLPHLLPGIATIVLHRPRIKDFWFHRHTSVASIIRDGMHPRGGETRWKKAQHTTLSRWWHAEFRVATTIQRTLLNVSLIHTRVRSSIKSFPKFNLSSF